MIVSNPMHGSITAGWLVCLLHIDMHSTRLAGMEQTAAQWGCTPQVGNATWRPKCAVEAITKNYIIHKTTNIFVPRFNLHREYKTINLDNVTYKMYNYSSIYKTMSRLSNIDMKSQNWHNRHHHNTQIHIIDAPNMITPCSEHALH